MPATQAGTIARLKSLQRVYVADGEPGEHLGIRMAKANETLPHNTVVLRCGLHASQRSMENALKATPPIAELLLELVTKCAETHDNPARVGSPGSLSRALRNRPKLLQTFAAKTREGIESKAESDQVYAKAPSLVPHVLLGTCLVTGDAIIRCPTCATWNLSRDRRCYHQMSFCHFNFWWP